VRAIELIAYGLPAPQGSKRFVGRAKSGRGIMVESSDKVAPWREAVKLAARRVIDAQPGFGPLDGPLRAVYVFTMPKPASAPKRRQTWPDRMPDLSKLVRSTEDALTDAGLWVDDARVVELCATKTYPGEGLRALGTPGVWLRVECMA
jgi:Holliday junction resolvase RusA-like endonuclease